MAPTGRPGCYAVGAFAGLAFMHIPVLVIILYAFTTEDRTYQFPPPGLTLRWFEAAFARSDIWQSLTLSLGVAACATVVAMILGTLAAFALARSSFRGKDALTVMFVLPIALPGIVTGIALLAAMKLGRIDPSFFTIVAGHATFCMVIVYNNVVARLRRLPSNWVEASMDLGADGSQTLRYVLLPQVATAFLAGGMLAFALSFDEIIVTIFTAGQRAHVAHLVLQRIVPAARPAHHQRGGGHRHRRDVDSNRARLLPHEARR